MGHGAGWTTVSRRLDIVVAKTAWSAVEGKLSDSDAVKSKIRARARSIPSMMRVSGLVVTHAFLLSRKAPEDQWVSQTLYSMVKAEVGGLQSTAKDFVVGAAELDLKTLSLAQAYSLISADHLKRACEVLFPDEKELKSKRDRVKPDDAEVADQADDSAVEQRTGLPANDGDIGSDTVEGKDENR